MSVLGMNLHDLVRGAIPPLHPDEDVLLVQSEGMENIRGVVTAKFAAAVLVRAQIQSVGNDDLRAMNDTMRTEIQRKAWLYSTTPAALVPQGINRPLARGGDMVRRADGSWWLVAALMEDFSASGWVSVRLVNQITVPPTAKARADEWDAEQAGNGGNDDAGQGGNP